MKLDQAIKCLPQDQEQEFPGEPNIDKTDVAESDQMGLTAVGYDPAGSIPISSDGYMWLFYMTPGNYWQPPPGGQPPGDYDLFVTSGFSL